MPIYYLKKVLTEKLSLKAYNDYLKNIIDKYYIFPIINPSI